MLFYGHYDVQPVDPLTLWETPPFEPRMATLPDGRKVIVARGACDDKGQLMTFVEACRAWKAVTGSLPVGITMLIEGAEEDGSKNLPEFVAEHRADLAARGRARLRHRHVGQRHPADHQFPARDRLRGTIVRCADRDLHSGSFGGAAANPIRVLARIIADLHDADGRITLEGFYDGVPETPSQVLEQWNGLGLTEEAFLGQVGLGKSHRREGPHPARTHPVAPDLRRQRHHRRLYRRGREDRDPRRGLGEGLVPPRGRPGSEEGERRASKSTSAPAFRPTARWSSSGTRPRAPSACPSTCPTSRRARAALQDEWGVAPITMGTGGSIPIVGDFKRTLGLDTLLVGFALDDDRVHSPNEKYDVKSFHKGARSWARILAALAE